MNGVLKQKKCSNPICNNLFNKFNSLQKYCSSKCMSACNKEKPSKQKKPINQVGKKQAIINAKYTVMRIEYLGRPENRICFIDGCSNLATTIEHRMGRKGFADDWARNNDIPLTLDIRYFAPCCHAHNLELENNPELSKQYQLSKIHGGTKKTI